VRLVEPHEFPSALSSFQRQKPSIALARKRPPLEGTHVHTDLPMTSLRDTGRATPPALFAGRARSPTWWSVVAHARLTPTGSATDRPPLCG